MRIDYGSMRNLYDPFTLKWGAYMRSLRRSPPAGSNTSNSFIAEIRKVSSLQTCALLELFGGVPKRVAIDNLKAGVIKFDEIAKAELMGKRNNFITLLIKCAFVDLG